MSELEQIFDAIDDDNLATLQTIVNSQNVNFRNDWVCEFVVN